ncbi:MAG: hypothetical protein SPF89_02770 [Sphaerochaetaceae bacterium]|nr:hypothetical protein [Spirochaetales bacterium]MDY5499007.1 hypothetical protein [Sphaerochaetaceae bacterium]
MSKSVKKEFSSSITQNSMFEQLIHGSQANEEPVKETVPAPTPAPVSHRRVQRQENKTKRAYLLVKPSILERSHACAEDMGISFNQLVENALLAYLKQNQY